MITNVITPINNYHMIKLIMIGLFVAFNFSVHGQPIANPQNNTIRWNASGFTDQNAKESMQGNSQFITYGNNKIDWVQKGGKLVYSLNVKSVDGTWTDANTDGSVIYNLSLNDLTGTLTIDRSSGTISIALNITGASDKINNSYAIINFDIL